MKEQHGLTGAQQSSGDTSQQQSDPHFGNYDLVRRIDVGGMGEVYLARQRTAFGREVAVKIIRSDLMHDVTARKRFLREAEVSAHLKHEHILPLFEFGEEQGRLFLVTPYIENGTLARRLQRGPMPLSEVHQLFIALVQAVAYIHKRGVVHRDLKPSNILLDQVDGQTYVRLIDFGIASIQGAAASAPLTSAGHEMGTLAYMAPERLSGIAAPSNDIYSLGIILYQMLTGQLPNTGKAVALPQVLELVIQRCIAPDPNQRYANADEVLKAFEYAYRFLHSSAAQKAQTGQFKAATIDESLPPDEPTPRRLPSTHAAPVTNEFADSIVLRREEMGSARVTTAFKGEDYNAPTAMIGPELVAIASKDRRGNTGVQGAVDLNGATGPNKRTPRKRRRVPLVVGLTLSIILVIIALIGFSVLAFQAAISATVTVTPQVHTISTIMNVTARIGQKNIDATNALIPASVLSSVQTTQASGPTTGQAQCIFGIFDCKQVVSQEDVDALTAQALPTLRTQIAQDLQRQILAKGVTQVGNFRYADPNSTANPPVGTESKTVTVSVSEQGFVEYIKTSDVTTLAHQLLDRKKTQEYGSKYQFLNQFTQIGQPVVESVDAQGTVHIQIAVVGLVKYQVTASDLSTLQSHIKGQKLLAAKSILSKQNGIDPTGVNIHISYGDTVPTNLTQIRISVVDPTNFPPVQLPTVKATPPNS